MSKRSVVFRNRLAIFLWVFTALWFVMLGVFSWLLFTDGPPSGTSMPVLGGVIAVFWLAGGGLLAWISNKPCTTVWVSNEKVSCVRRYPFRVEAQTFALAQVSAAEVIECVDSEGDPYFRASVAFAGGEQFDLAEGHSRERCEAACDRFNQAAGAKFV